MMTRNQIMAKVLFSNNLVTKAQIQEFWDKIDDTHDLGTLLLENGVLDRTTFDAVDAYVRDLEIKLNAEEKPKAPSGSSFERPVPKSPTPVPSIAPLPESAPQTGAAETPIALEGNNPYGQANATSVQIEKVSGLEQTSIAPVAVLREEETDGRSETEKALPDRFEIESGEGSLEIPERLSAENSLAQILAFARKHEATDVYLSENSRVAFRVFGKIVYAGDFPCEASRLSGFLSEAKSGFADGYEPAVGVDFSKSFALSGAGRNRLTVTWNETVPALSVRLVSALPISLDKLYLPAFCTDFLKLSSGLVLIAGTAESGRSTTLCAFGKAISDSREVLLKTVEKPIERVLHSERGLILQKEVGLHVRSGDEAVRDAVRTGANVVLFDHLESLDELWSLLRAASSGVLVFAVTTGSDIYGLLSRLLSEAGDREEELAYALSGGLKGVLVQHLLPVIEGQGWVLAVEALNVTASVADLIRRRDLARLPQAIAMSRDQGLSLDDSLQNLVDAGFIRGEDAWRCSLNRRRFAAYRPGK